MIERAQDKIATIARLSADELRGWADNLRARNAGPDRPYPGEWEAIYRRAKQLGVRL